MDCTSWNNLSKYWNYTIRNGEEYKTIKLESGKTSYEFKDLETYAPDGSVYNYSVEETKLSNYTSEKAENGVDFINTIKQEQVSVRGSKTWVIPAGKIVPTITINLLRDGEKVNSVELTMEQHHIHLKIWIDMI